LDDDELGLERTRMIRGALSHRCAGWYSFFIGASTTRLVRVERMAMLILRRWLLVSFASVLACGREFRSEDGAAGAGGEASDGVPTSSSQTGSGAAGGSSNGCSQLRGDCNGSKTDGCEVDLATDPKHCGSCQHACSFANASAGCTNGLCTILSCNPGFANCDQ